MMLQQKVLHFLSFVLLSKPTLSSPFLSAIKKLTQSPKSGLIISGGYDTMDSLTNTVELVMMKDGEVSQQCSLPAMPGARRGHIIEANLTCGGSGGLGEDSSLDTCIMLGSEGGWRETHSLAKGRSAHKTWVLDESVPLWGPWESISAGQARSDGPITGLLYTFNSNPNSACAISDEDTDSFIIIGGKDEESSPVSSVKRYNIKGHVEDLPSLRVARQGHGCSSFMKNDKRVLVVAGGMTADGYTASTEILEDGEWREVGKLPMPMADLRGVTLQDTVIMTGGKDGDSAHTHILAYNADTEQWTKAGDMKSPRADHAVSPIEAGYIDMCS